MITIKNALLYIQNYDENTIPDIKNALFGQNGVSRVEASAYTKGMIFIDYQPRQNTMDMISRVLKQSGVQNVIIGM